MLKRTIKKKGIITISSIFALLLMYLMPKTEITIPNEVTYSSIDNETSVIYLMDNYNYLGRTEVAISDKTIEGKAKSLLEILIKGGNGENKIQNGFKAIIPSDTIIKSIDYESGLIKVNFSKELLDVKEDLEEKIVEAITYTLTSIEGVDKVIIYVEGDILTKLPKSGINLPSTLDKRFGINKEYSINKYKDVNEVTIYYVSKYNDNEYYVPVTKYLNDSRDKIKIIVDELSSAPIYHTNLMSYLNNNITLLASKEEMDTLYLTFNDYIFSDISYENILEEVIYTLCLSISDNYDVSNVVFIVNNQEIYKSVLKSIEK